MRRRRGGLVLVLGAVACTSSQEPGRSETWAADLTQTRQVLTMTVERRGAEVTGTGVLASLTDPGGTALTVSGTRLGDTLSVTYRRELADPFRFVGRYVPQGIVGTLDGAEFRQVPASFRRR